MSPTNEAITPALSRERLAGSFPGDLGIELPEIEDARVIGRMKVDRRHLHPMGYVHGGAWVAFADTVAAWGTMRNLAGDRGFTTVELKINVIASAVEGDELDSHRRTAPRRLADTGLAGAGDAGRAARRDLHLHPDDSLTQHLEGDLDPVGDAPEPKRRVDPVGGRVLQVGEQGAAQRPAVEGVTADRRDGAARVAATARCSGGV